MNNFSQDFWFQAWLDSTNAFINFMNKFLLREEARNKMRVLKKIGALIEALLLLGLDLYIKSWELTSSSCSLIKFTKILM